MSMLCYCSACKRYTMNEVCPVCKVNTGSPKPARYSPQDHYGKYRRKLKQLQKNV
ncbi:MAG: RNA-protein complex protein Nop10 [Euryarchaeota archaeon]|nr:RNA-protein complex protein Nop10 [Euryarchaeota archaeon]